MSAFGTKRTSNCHSAMSAFGGKADIVPSRSHAMRHDGCSYLPELLRNTRLREPFIF
jgi:hypothetical protein